MTIQYQEQRHQTRSSEITNFIEHTIKRFVKKFFQKISGACVFRAPVFFPRFLAGKLKIVKQMLLTAITTRIFFKIGAWVFSSARILNRCQHGNNHCKNVNGSLTNKFCYNNFTQSSDFEKKNKLLANKKFVQLFFRRSLDVTKI